MSGSAHAATLCLMLAWPLQPVDDAVRAWVHGVRQPGLDAPMRIVSDRSRVLLIAGGVLAVASGTSGRAFVVEAACALLPVNAVVEALKWGVGRVRPDGDANRRNSSFPSSHAANACTVAAVIARRWRRAAIPAACAAMLVAFSRLYLDRHWFSDVLFAALLAVACAWGSAWLTRRWLKSRSAVRVS